MPEKRTTERARRDVEKENHLAPKQENLSAKKCITCVVESMGRGLRSEP